MMLLKRMLAAMMLLAGIVLAIGATVAGWRSLAGGDVVGAVAMVVCLLVALVVACWEVWLLRIGLRRIGR